MSTTLISKLMVCVYTIYMYPDMLSHFICAYVYTYICIYIYICVCVCVEIDVPVYVVSTCMPYELCIYSIRIYPLLIYYIYVHTYIHIYTRIYIYGYI